MIRSRSFLFLLLVLITSCHWKKEIPFPENPSGFSHPITKPFKMPPSVPIEWKEISPDSMPKPTTVKFDLDKLPSKPFTLNDFKLLKSPLKTTPFDWDNLEQIPVNLDTVKGKPLSVKQIILPKPTITKALPPNMFPNTTTGILNLTQSDGLPSNSIRTCFVDKHGVIWLGVPGGLCKYTGEYFYTYSFLPQIESSPSTIVGVAADKEENLWLISSSRDLYKLNNREGTLHLFDINEFQLSIHIDHKDVVWLVSETGVNFIDADRKTIKRMSWEDDSNVNYDFFDITEDQKHNIWINNQNQVCILNDERNSFKKIGEEQGLKINEISTMFEDNEGRMWLGSHENTSAISLENKEIINIEEFHGAHSFAQDKAGKLWFVDHEWVAVYNQKTNTLKKISLNQDIFRLKTPGYDNITAIDKNGILILCSSQSGLIIIDPLGPLPEHLNTATGLADDNIWGTAEDQNGRIWLSTFAGLNIYDPNKNELMVFDKENGLPVEDINSVSFRDRNNLFVFGTGGFSVIDVKENYIKSYHPDPSIGTRFFDGLTDRNGNLWIGSINSLLMLDLKTHSLKKVKQTRGQRFWAMTKDDQGMVWVVTDNGLKIIDPINSTLTSITASDGLNSNYLSCLYKTTNGEMWIGGDKGISIINPAKNEIISLSQKEGLVPETIFDFAEVNNRMYAGSLDGLIMITQPDSVNKNNEWGFYNYGKRDGFPFNDYNQMSASTMRNGQSWWGVTPMLTVLTQAPAVRTDSAKTHVTGITIMDQSPSFRSPLKKLPNNEDTLWTPDLTKFYTHKTVSKDSGYYADHKIRWDSITPTFHNPMGLELPYDQNSLSFSFTNMSVTGRDEILYRYVLEGSDNAWSASSSEPHSKNYYNLKQGEYSFKVASKGFNGRWGKPDVLNFAILPPWWATWWAYSAYVIVLAALVFGIVQYRSQHLKLENRKLEERVNHRTAQLKKTIDELKTTQSQLIQSEKMASLGELTAGIAHEIQNPLNFVNNFSEVSNELIQEMEDEIQKGNLNEVKAIAIDVKQNMQKILQHGKRADGIVKGMLQHSRNGSGQKELTDLNALCDEYLRLAYHGYRAKDKSFNSQFKTDFDPALEKAQIVPQDMGRVMLNLINNAFYAVNEKGKQNLTGYEPTVTVSTKKNGNHVEIKVSDNGNGVSEQIREKIFQPFFSTKPTGQGTGLGLSLSYDIVKAHHGAIKIETKENVGTEFLIALPI